MKRSPSKAVTFGKCTLLNNVLEFLHSSAFLTILTNYPFPLRYSCILCGSMPIKISPSEVNDSLCFVLSSVFSGRKNGRSREGPDGVQEESGNGPKGDPLSRRSRLRSPCFVPTRIGHEKLHLVQNKNCVQS